MRQRHKGEMREVNAKAMNSLGSIGADTSHESTWDHGEYSQQADS